MLKGHITTIHANIAILVDTIPFNATNYTRAYILHPNNSIISYNPQSTFHTPKTPPS
jgi:hypothetical protein